MSELRMHSLVAAIAALIAYYSIQFYRFAVEPAQAHTTERAMMVQACCIRGKAFTENQKKPRTCRGFPEGPTRARHASRPPDPQILSQSANQATRGNRASRLLLLTICR
jgi:hypothetical protein